MKINKENWLVLVLSVFCLFACLILSYIQMERIIKKEFTNSLTYHMQNFNSPVTIILFTSGIIWFCCEITKCCINQENSSASVDQYTQLEIGKSTQLQIQPSRISNQTLQANQQMLTQKQKRIVLKALPRKQIMKIVIPGFLSTLFFLYGIQYLGFPKVMIFKILSKVGLVNLYQSLFQNGQNKMSKFVISILTFVGFALFNYSFKDSAKNEQNEKLHKIQIIHGYIFVILMSYLSLAKNIFQKKIQKQYGKLTSLDKLIMENRANIIMAYLLSLYLKQQIYGLVFACLHYQFIQCILFLGFLLLVGCFSKKYIQNNFSSSLTNFLILLQKNSSLFISLISAANGVSNGQIIGICIIIFMGFVNFILEQVSSEQDYQNQQIKVQEKVMKAQIKQLYRKNDDIHDQDEKINLKNQQRS